MEQLPCDCGEDGPAPLSDDRLDTRQFGQKRKLAEERYREFVRAGVSKRGIWSEVKGQSILGEEKFSEEMVGYVKGVRDITEIPRMQRYLDRPKLEELLEILTRKRQQGIMKE